MNYKIITARDWVNELTKHDLDKKIYASWESQKEIIIRNLDVKEDSITLDVDSFE